MFSFQQVVSVIFVVDEFILRASQRHIFTCLTTWCVPIDSFSQPPMRWGCRTFSWYFLVPQQEQAVWRDADSTQEQQTFVVPMMDVMINPAPYHIWCVRHLCYWWIYSSRTTEPNYPWSEEGTSVIFVINGDIFHARRRHASKAYINPWRRGL